MVTPPDGDHDYKPQNRKSNSKQKTSPQSYKTQINILPFPGLAQTGTEQLGQGATLLGWSKSIYLICEICSTVYIPLLMKAHATSLKITLQQLTTCL